MCFTLLSVKVYFINLVLVIQVLNACNLSNKLRIMKLSQLKNPGYCSLNSLDKKAFNSCFRNWTEMHVSLIDLRFEMNVTEIIGFKSARYFLIRHVSKSSLPESGKQKITGFPWVLMQEVDICLSNLCLKERPEIKRHLTKLISS